MAHSKANVKPKRQDIIFTLVHFNANDVHHIAATKKVPIKPKKKERAQRNMISFFGTL